VRVIQQYLPNPRRVEQMRIFVAATPEESWNVARHFDMSSIQWVRFLFDLRTIADHLQHPSHTHIDRRLGVDQIVENGHGFMLLHEESGKEVVVGAIGKFWKLHIPFADVSPGEFKNFDDEGWGKIAWSISVEPFLSGSTISIELRITATDDESWKKLKRYFQLIGPFSHLIRKTSLSKMERNLGKLQRPKDEHN